MHDTNVRCTEMIRSGAPVNPGTIYLSHPSRPCAAACPARQGRHQVVRRQDRARETQQRQGNMNLTGTSLQHISKRKCRTPAVHTERTRSAHACISATLLYSSSVSLPSPNLLGAHAGRVAPARPHQRRAHAGCGAQALRCWSVHAVCGAQALPRRKGAPSVYFSSST